MPRTRRYFNQGGIYHIINRGVEKRNIFLKNQDYSRFILGLEFFNGSSPIDLWKLIARGGTVPAQARLAEERKERRRLYKPLVELIAFVLMPNHYHFIIREIVKNGISSFMRKMGGYATYFNKQYDRTGSLFQSRYKVVEIKNEEQLNNVFVYLHTNPIELIEPQWKDLKVKNFQKAVKWLADYKWSSYRDYIGKLNFPMTTKRDFFLDFYNKEKGCRGAVEDWIMFKAKNIELGSEIIE